MAVMSRLFAHLPQGTHLANMEEALSTLESADDMTAADTAPSPKNDTKSGVRCCSTSGRIMDV